MININCGRYTQDLEQKQLLGQGAFGEVYLGFDNRGKPFAVKKSKCINASTYATATGEIQILMTLKHNNIAQMYAFDFQDNQAILVMEYCSGGNLNTRLNDPISDHTKVSWILQLIEAIKYLHGKKIVHRDLKPDNVLLKDEVIKLTDFGISRWYLTHSSNSQEENNLSEYVEAFMGTFAGTPYWVAPEVFDQRYTEKADVFSLGVVCHAILTRQSFVYGNEKYFGAFVEHNRKKVGIGLAMFERQKNIDPDFSGVDLSKSLNREIASVIKKMLQNLPEKRIDLFSASYELERIQLSLRKRPISYDSSQIDGSNGKRSNFPRSYTQSTFAQSDEPSNKRPIGMPRVTQNRSSRVPSTRSSRRRPHRLQSPQIQTPQPQRNNGKRIVGVAGASLNCIDSNEIRHRQPGRNPYMENTTMRERTIDFATGLEDPTTSSIPSKYWDSKDNNKLKIIEELMLYFMLAAFSIILFLSWIWGDNTY